MPEYINVTTERTLEPYRTYTTTADITNPYLTIDTNRLYVGRSLVTDTELKKALDDFAHRIYEIVSSAVRIDISEEEFMEMLKS